MLLTRQEAADHCNQTFRQPYPNDGRLYCDVNFDGVLCWNYTLAGSRAYGGCPIHHQHSHIFTPSGYSFKDCGLNGTWYTFPGTHRPWTNYTLCAKKDTVEKSRHVLYVYMAGYAVSVLCLLMSIVIFRYFHKQLKSTRIKLHTNLFISYILTGALWIIYFSKALLDTQTLAANPIWCKMLNVAAQYAMVSNHAWMFAEGFFLHSSIVFTFTRPGRLYVICIVIGWVFPVLPALAYAIVRALSSSNTDHTNCWAENPAIMWVLMAPILISLLVNCGFLVNILRIFVSKIRSSTQPSLERSKIRQTVRACLILIPLLGIQFIIFPFRSNSHPYEYDVFVAITVSSQGAFVAVLFCFLNGEVNQNCRKRVKDFRSRNETRKTRLDSIVTSLRRLSHTSFTRRSSATVDRRPSCSRNSTDKQAKSDTPLNQKGLSHTNDSKPEIVESNNTSNTSEELARVSIVDDECLKHSLLPIQEV